LRGEEPAAKEQETEGRREEKEIREREEEMDEKRRGTRNEEWNVKRGKGAKRRKRNKETCQFRVC
jgi:hypothetical protein